MKPKRALPVSTDPGPRRFRRVINTVQEIVAGGVIRAHKTGPADPAFGFWLGIDPADGQPKFTLGGATAFIAWDGAQLLIRGRLIGAASRLTEIADATADTDALNRRTADGRYLPQSAGWTGSFPTPDGRTVTVTNGQITHVT